jgi:hypothetical protein
MGRGGLVDRRMLLIWMQLRIDVLSPVRLPFLVLLLLLRLRVV